MSSNGGSSDKQDPLGSKVVRSVSRPWEPGDVPPDRIPSPVILVGVGSFGHRVVERIEASAAEMAEVFGPDSVRNLATYRVMSREALERALRTGYTPTAMLDRTGMVFEVPQSVLPYAFEDETVLANPGLEPNTLPDNTQSASRIFENDLKQIVSLLFRLDRFVDYHPDQNRFCSRLDVFVIEEAEDPLSHPVNAVLQRSMTRLVQGPLAPLFIARRQNLAIHHLLGFPLVRSEASSSKARALLAAYQSVLEQMSEPRGPTPARFLFLEDRSYKYVLSDDQLVSMFAAWIRVSIQGFGNDDGSWRELRDPELLMGRRGAGTDKLTHLCNTFSSALAEVPVARVMRYCRNRQAIALLNCLLQHAPDGSSEAPTRPKNADRDAWLLAERYGTNAGLQAQVDEICRDVMASMDSQVRETWRRHGLDPIQLKDLSPWEYHGNIVETFHGDVHGKGEPYLTDALLVEYRNRLIRSLQFIVQNFVPSCFEELEREGMEVLQKVMDEERAGIDRVVKGCPWGWKEALERLHRSLGHLRQCRDDIRSALDKTEVHEICHRTGLRKTRGVIEQAENEVDLKPVAERYRDRMMPSLGAVAGVGLGAIGAWVFPHHLFGVTVASVVSVPGMVAGARYWSERYNRNIHQRISKYVSSGQDCEIAKNLIGARNELMDVSDPASFLGERVKWIVLLWKLRFYTDLITCFEGDVKRLEDVGSILMIQLERFRADQEKIGVRFTASDGMIRETPGSMLVDQDHVTHQLLSEEGLQAIYDAHFHPSFDMAMRLVVDTKVYEHWRKSLPFSDFRVIADFCLRPFLPVESIDFWTWSATEDSVHDRLMAFMGDYANKLEKSGAVSEVLENFDEARLLCFHADHKEKVKEGFSQLGHPEGWSLCDGFTVKNLVCFVRQVHRLAPWQIPAVGNQLDMVREMVESELHGSLAGVIGRAASPNLRASMAIAAIDALWRRFRENRPCNGWEAIVRSLVRLCQDVPGNGERPMDCTSFVPLTSISEWTEHFAGSPGLVPLLVRSLVAGTDQGPMGLQEAWRRCLVLLSAARQEPVWIYQEVKKYKPDWVDADLGALVHGEATLDLVLQGRHGDASTLLGRLRNEVVKNLTILRALVMGEPAPDGSWAPFTRASEWLQMVVVPRRRQHSSLPQCLVPPFDSVLLRFGNYPKGLRTATLLAHLYGAPEWSSLDEAPNTNRGRYLLETMENVRSKLLEALEQFPAEMIDPQIIAFARKGAL